MIAGKTDHLLSTNWYLPAGTDTLLWSHITALKAAVHYDFFSGVHFDTIAACHLKPVNIFNPKSQEDIEAVYKELKKWSSLSLEEQTKDDEFDTMVYLYNKFKEVYGDNDLHSFRIEKRYFDKLLSYMRRLGFVGWCEFIVPDFLMHYQDYVSLYERDGSQTPNVHLFDIESSIEIVDANYYKDYEKTDDYELARKLEIDLIKQKVLANIDAQTKEDEVQFYTNACIKEFHQYNMFDRNYAVSEYEWPEVVSKIIREGCISHKPKYKIIYRNGSEIKYYI